VLNSQTTRRDGGLPAWLFVALALSASCGGEPQTGRTAEPAAQQAGTAPSPIPWKTIEPPVQVGGQQPSVRQTPAPVTRHSGVGVIRSINLKEGWFEIDHEEIPGFMAAMQMQWSVKDRAMLKSVRVGDKVNFTVEDDNGTEVITELKKAPASP
jgi:Cu/Ag efflux protein CusF